MIRWSYATQRFHERLTQRSSAVIIEGSMPKALALIAVLAVVALVTAACGSGTGSQEDDVDSPGSPTASPTDDPAPTLTAIPSTPTGSVIFPPFEGPTRSFRAEERINYREHPAFQFPNPEDLPVPPDELEGLEFHPPETPDCPLDLELLVRPSQGFRVCYPKEYKIDGHGYVTALVDDRWYSLGLFGLDQDDRESVHVSIYVTNAYSQPFTYVINCETAYQVTIDGQPATLCPDHPGEFPEVKIIAYHIRMGDLDYFIQVVPQFDFDDEANEYLTTWSQEAEETAIRIVHSFQFIEIPDGS